MRLPELSVPSHPFVSIEHVNINSGPWTTALQEFYYDILGFADDSRALAVRQRTNAAGGSFSGLHWVNIGLQQFHLPSSSPQVIRGRIGLSYESLEQLEKRLEAGGIPLEKVRQDDGQLTNLIISCPIGNKLCLHEQKRCEGSLTWFGPAPTIPVPSPEIALPGGQSLGLGMEYVDFDVPLGTAQIIHKFYKHFFNTEVAELEMFESSGGPGSFARCVVPLGFHQRIIFSETDKEIPPYDGYHIAIYVNDFVETYRRLKAANLHWDNPRFPQFSYRTEEQILQHNEYRFKDFIDLETGEVVYELEHEIRSLAHPQFSCKKWITPQMHKKGDEEEEEQGLEKGERSDLPPPLPSTTAATKFPTS